MFAWVNIRPFGCSLQYSIKNNAVQLYCSAQRKRGCRAAVTGVHCRHMPYIPQEDRDAVDAAVDALADRIVERAEAADNEAAFAGLLNYASTRLALTVIKRRFGRVRYWIIAATTGALRNAAEEFYRRIGTPYEEAQIAKNGDVDLYAEFDRELRK